MLAINTDRQLKLELPPIINDSNITQNIIILILTNCNYFCFNYLIVVLVSTYIDFSEHFYE